MAAHTEALIIDSLNNTWSNSTFGANVTVSASVSPAVKAKAVLTQIGWSFKNLTAAAATAVLEVRDASITGTILGRWEMMCPATSSIQDTFGANIQGLRGSPINISFNTVQTSVSYSLSCAGWINSLSDG